MPSTISAGTSAGTALNITSDTTGNLAFQTNNGVTALTIDTSQNVTFANNVTYTGTITATAGFSGNGAGLTAINASNVASGTLAVARGGTGTSSPSLVAGSGISITGSFPNQTIASSSSGYAGPNVQLFTSSGTFTVPTGITKVKVTVVGGGGGGGGARAQPTCDGAVAIAGGGGSGGQGTAWVTGLTPGGTVSVTVGSGGTAGASTPGAGGNGGTSSFGSFASATGGLGSSGTNAVGTVVFGTNGSNGSFSSGSTNLNIYVLTTRGNGGPGGYAERNPGQGTQNVAGTAGTAGVVLVEW